MANATTTNKTSLLQAGINVFPDGMAASGTFTANGTTLVVVANTKITADSHVVITLKTVGGTVGAIPSIKVITAGTGFSVSGTASDTSVYNYKIL
jgi:hypothetical protein